MYGYMKVHCPICRCEFDGMKPYGRRGCCSKDCNREWQWRETLAIMNEQYKPDPTREPVEQGIA